MGSQEGRLTQQLEPGRATRVDSFEGALKVLDQYARSNTFSTLTYRGHSDSTWRVSPSLFRQNPDVSEFEHELIREMISLYPHEFTHDVTMFDRLVRLQHYGLPTRLLDVTRNPLVALFFAVSDLDCTEKDGAVLIFTTPTDRCKFYDSDVVSCMANLANLKAGERASLMESKATSISEFSKIHANDRLVQFIRAEKPYFQPRIKKVDLFRPVFVTAKRSNQRMAAQSGCFIIYGLPADEGPEYKRNIKVDKLIIPHQIKTDLQRRLQSIGIEISTLFPEIDKAGGRILESYQSKVIDW